MKRTWPHIVIALVSGGIVTLGLLGLLKEGLPAASAQGPDGQATYYVAPTRNCGGMTPCYDTVQAAVDAADHPDDVIKVATGVYTGVNSLGGLAQVVFVNKTVTIQGGYSTANWASPDPEAHPTTLDAQGQGRVLYVTGAIAPTVEGLRITGGDATGLGGGPWGGLDFGGGIYAHTATVTLNRNEVSGNTASVGAGVCLYNSPAALGDNHISANTAGFYGGGLALWTSAATLTDNTVSSNTSYFGGGLYLRNSDATLSGNTLDGNSVSSGGVGGGAFLYGNAILSGNTVVNNNASTGGGLSLDNSKATLTGNVVAGNQATTGGGLYLERSDPVLTNNVVAGNQASRGSGFYVYRSNPRLLHTTIARNNAGDGTGLYVTLSSVELTNTVLVSHTVGITVASDSAATLEATLWGSDAWANDTDWAGDGSVLAGTRNHWDAPAFVDPDAGDYHIRSGSGAIDRGLDAGVTQDIDGDPRPLGAGYDIGADEFPPMPAIDVTKRAYPDPARSGSQLTYVLAVTNTGNVHLHATITDVLPGAVTPGGVLVWMPEPIVPQGVWAETVVVTIEEGYSGTLSNELYATTEEGVSDAYTENSTAQINPPNRPPHTVTHPVPADGAADVPITQTLSWHGGDPDGTPVTYTMALGTSDPPPIVGTTTVPRYDPTLIADTTYYWAVTATDGISTTTGPTWRFRTVGPIRIYLPLTLRNSG